MNTIATIPGSQAHALKEACIALWRATLSLMLAFMQQQAPAHRYLLARRIAANFTTLCEQECFVPDTRASFSRLAQRWTDQADRFSPDPKTAQRQRPGRLAGFLPCRW